MIEHLGPNMARSILGNAYNPDFRYELATDDEGFHVIITNPEDGTSSYIKLDPEEPNPDKLKPIWQEGVKEGPPRADILSKVLLGFFLAAMCVCIAAAVIIKFM